jgi:23S rRNA pseudouridine2605 synthase
MMQAVKRRTGNNKGEVNPSKKAGLARALSKLGYCSRSRAAELIVAGRVKLNGTLQRDPETPVHLGKDRIEIDGRPLANRSKIYLVLNKPRGVVTTAADEKGRETVYAHLPADLPWLAPVGRLDKASEGLLLLTNDSEWAARIAAPETHLDKTYHVQISAIADEKLLPSLRNGIRTGDGEFLRMKSVRVLREGERHSWLEIVLDEGKNRHIRRMLEELKIEVLRLVRVAIGTLALGDLPKGATRPLDREEKQALDRAMRVPNREPTSSVR